MSIIQNVHFAGQAGQQLAGKLHLPRGSYRGAAIFAHCFTCSKETLAATRIAAGLAAAGVAVLRFDFTGLRKGRTGVLELVGIQCRITPCHGAVEFPIGNAGINIFQFFPGKGRVLIKVEGLL